MHAKHETNHTKPQQKIRTKENNTENITNNCNCSVKETCSVDEKCQTSSLIYHAIVTRHDNNKDESYIRLTDNTFKTRYNGHTNSFQSKKYRNATALSNYNLDTERQKKLSYSIKWKITEEEDLISPQEKIVSSVI